MAEYNRQAYGVSPAKTLFLDNDIDLARFRPLSDDERRAAREALGLPVDRPVLLFVHKLCRERGAHYLIPVIEACAAAGQPVTVVAVGASGNEQETLAAYAAEHPDRLHLAGRQPNHQMPTFYGLADLYLMPSSYREGFPRRILESMACGTPLVTTDVGCIREVLPPTCHGELMAPPDDVGAFARLTAALLARPERRAELSALLLERVRHYDVARVAEQYCRVLCEPAAVAGGGA
jgi:glycosyltransferase involved in cell wall biosynthesis